MSPEERKKHREVLLGNEIDCLGNLTMDDVRILRDTEDEYSRKGSFLRVYPDSDAKNFQKLFQPQPYYDRLVSQWVVKYPLEKRIQILKGIPIMTLRKINMSGSTRNSSSFRDKNFANRCSISSSAKKLTVAIRGSDPTLPTKKL